MKPGPLTATKKSYFVWINYYIILNLYKKGITNIGSKIFSDLLNIDSIDLSHNRLEFLDIKLFKNLEVLQMIELNGNAKLAEKNELELYLEYNVKFVSFKHDLHDNDIDLVKNSYFEII